MTDQELVHEAESLAMDHTHLVNEKCHTHGSGIDIQSHAWKHPSKVHRDRWGEITHITVPAFIRVPIEEINAHR